jgi:hypothetical protein
MRVIRVDPLSRHMSGSEIWLIQHSKLAIVTGVFASLSLKLRRERQICWCRGEGITAALRPATQLSVISSGFFIFCAVPRSRGETMRGLKRSHEAISTDTPDRLHAARGRTSQAPRIVSLGSPSRTASRQNRSECGFGDNECLSKSGLRPPVDVPLQHREEGLPRRDRSGQHGNGVRHKTERRSALSCRASS